MAFTKITNAGFGLTTGTLVGVAASFSSTVSVGGTLTYEDVTNVDSVGLITARNGIEVTDKGVQVGTGATVDSAAANTLTFLTGGSERLRITSGGNIGIGTISPGLPLDVVSNTSSETVRFRGASGGTGTLRFTSIDGGTNYSFIQSRSTYFDLGTDASIPLRFSTAGSERLRVTSAGNIGIKSTDPTSYANSQATLVIEDTISPALCISDTGQARDWFIIGQGDGLAINYADGGGSGSASNVTGAMFLRNNGNIGINESTPTDFLHILPTDGKGITLKTTENHSAQITADCNRSAADNTILSIRGNWNGTGVAAIELTTSDDTSNKDDGNILFKTASSGGNVNQRMQINRSGQILINGAGDVFNGRTGFFNDTGGSGTQLQIEGSIYAYSSMSITRNGSGTSGPIIILAKGRGGTTVVNSGDEMGKLSFQGAEGGGDMVEAAKITSEVDGTPGTSDMPGRLIFSTTADGASSPTERMRIDSNGTIHMGDRASAGNAAHFSTATVNISKPDDLATSFSKAACFLHIGNASSTLNGVYPIGFGFSTNDRTHLPAYIAYFTEDAGGAEHGPLIFATRNVTTDTAPTERCRVTSDGHFLVAKGSTAFATAGHLLGVTGSVDHTRDNAPIMYINRTSSDGSLVQLYQDSNLEGSISVSGSTVSYNGGHLTRWSQLASGAARTEILRGSVLSNLDEMCEWGDENNEQLNRMKVSDVEGDINVAGVFQAWDDDDDTYTNDFYCAMTGDFVIRIASGVTVQRGNLLMSAGDGTAKPQGDGYIQDKTIAKVTSTTVSTTYSDGSYCVPCVLMAC